MDEFDEFVRSRYERLCRYAYLLTGDWQHAEDLVQSALARCHPALRRGVDNPDAYVARAILNGYRSWRRRFWHRELPTERLPERPAPGAAGEMPDAVLDALHALPPDQRAVIALRFLCDQSEEQTAQILGVPRGTVKSRTARALAALRPASRSDRALLGGMGDGAE